MIIEIKRQKYNKFEDFSILEYLLSCHILFLTYYIARNYKSNTGIQKSLLKKTWY